MKLWRIVANHLLPHRGNAHRPHILRRGWLVAFLALALASEGVILSNILISSGPNVFLAAVVRSEVVDYTREARLLEGGQALAENEVLNAAAQAKAEDMAARGYFSHVGPAGEEPWVWIERAGYEYVYAGENLAVRFNDSKDVVDAWMASPTHRANILKANYKEIGVGIAQGAYKGGRATFIVQYFASPANPVAVSAVPDVPAAGPASSPTVATQTLLDAAVAGAETELAAPQEVAPASAQSSAQAQVQVPAAPAPEHSFAQSAARAATQAVGDAPKGASWVLAGIAMLLIAVLALTFFIRIQVQPTDLLLPGVAVALVVITLMGANAKFLPASTQSASVAVSDPGEIAEGTSTERMSVFPEAPAR